MKLGVISSKISGVTNILYLRGLAKPQRNNLLNRFLFTRDLTHIIANSHETKRCLRANLSACLANDDVQVIYHGVDLDDFDRTVANQAESPIER